MTAPTPAREERPSRMLPAVPVEMTREQRMLRRSSLTKLFLSQLFAGAGVASGYAVGALLAEQITGETAMAGFAQMSTILGAGLLAYPLSALAARSGRRIALTLGFGIGLVGAVVVLLGAMLALLPLFMFGMMLCGSAVAAGLQARYAAVDASGGNRPGSAMALIVWATTVGSVLGPNFMTPGAVLGESLGMNPLAGPYLISMACFLLATVAAFTLAPQRRATVGANRGSVQGARGSGAGKSGAGGSGAAPSALDAQGFEQDAQGFEQDARDSTTAPNSPENQVKLLDALRFAASYPKVRFAIIALIAGQMVMTNVMVMTPVHMNHQAFDLTAVGFVISIHILGMYVFSPIFGWAADKFGPYAVIAAGFVVYAITVTLGIWDALLPTSNMSLLSVALFMLGVGWSLFLIGGSALLVESAPERMLVPLQGVSDSTMNLGGALMAAFAGTMLQVGGFVLINAVAGVVVVIAFGFALASRRKRPAPATD